MLLVSWSCSSLLLGRIQEAYSLLASDWLLSPQSLKATDGLFNSM